MGRGRGKSKKQNIVTAHDELESGEVVKVPASKRRARTQKSLKSEIAEDVSIDKFGIDGDNAYAEDEIAEENGTKKRKSFPAVKGNLSPVVDENGSAAKLNTESPIKSSGSRHNGSRRKSTPHRAAEPGVNCMLMG